jgi:poly-gamma-glutamate capsule biosynthesis protein CapA/YwtB (metallophosphatase superfamily)
MRRVAVIVLLGCGAAAPQPSPMPSPTPIPSPTPSPSPSPIPSPSPTPSPTPVTLGFVGDVMLGTTFPDESGKSLPPDDGRHLLDEVAPILSGVDVAFANLEGPLVDGGVSAKCGPVGRKPKKTKSCWAFRVPTRYGQYLKDAGFDVMGLANNHAMDFGLDGRESTIRVLDTLGIAHSGPVGDIAHLTVRGARIAVVAFATYATAYNLNDLDAARAVVAGEVGSNDIVVVSFHGGAEGASRTHVPAGAELFLGEKRGDLRTFTLGMIDAGAALVVGHGPHVGRGLELYQGRLIAYSLGNFATYGGMNLLGVTGISLILEVKLEPGGRFLGAQIHPVVQLPPGGPHLDAERRVIPLLQELSAADFAGAAPAIAEDGRVSASR